MKHSGFKPNEEEDTPSEPPSRKLCSRLSDCFPAMPEVQHICQMPHGFSLFKNTQVAIFPVAVTSFWAQLRVRWVFQKWSASDISDEPFVILKQPKECCKYASNIIDKSLTTAANSQEIGYTKLSVSIYWAQICVALSGYLIRHSKSTNFNILTYLRGYQSVGIVASWLPKLQRGVLIEK